MEFLLLGPLEARFRGRPLPLGGPKQRAVLANLLLRANEAVPRGELVDAVWGERPPKSAVGSLQVYVHGLRQTLGAERIVTRGGSYRLHVEPGELDLERFRRLVAEAHEALAGGRAGEAADALDEAVGLWRGPALAGLVDLDETARAASEGLEEQRVEAVELRVDARLALGRPELVVTELQQLIERHPYRERLRGQLILALYRTGRQTEALEAYRAARAAWVDELGVEPSPALQELERAVLRHDASLSGRPAADGIAASRLPAPTTSLVGRRLEVAAVAALLRSEARLVTLVGPGGTGKTRLALAVAAELEPERDQGALFVDLSATTDPDLLLPAVAQALGLADTGPSLLADLRAHLAVEAPLLVLDNLEQLLPGTERLAELLAASARLRILATSRAPLRLSGEHVYPVPPLPLPAPAASVQELRRNDAVRLFAARSGAADPAFALDDANAASVAAICRRLDGLPLALELAAARIRHLSPADLLARLERRPELLGTGPRDAPARQRTLAATIAWSFELLDHAEREALVRLSVFAGGWPLEAAERVGDVDDAVLGALVDHSLVQRAGDRFAMLETVRSYALALLDVGEGDAVRRAHAEWLVELAEDAEADLLAGRNTVPWLDRVEHEHDNVRAALGWALEHGAADLALRLASALRTYWEVRGHFVEAERWLDAALATGGVDEPALRAKALAVAGTIAFRRGDLERAQERYEEMLALWRGLGDDEGIARGLSDLGTVAAAAGDHDRAVPLLEESAEGFRALGEHKRLAVVLSNLGHVSAQRGDYETAVAVTTESLALERGSQRPNEAISLYNLGSYAFEAGDAAEARRRLKECLVLTSELGYKEVSAYALATVVRILLAEGDAARSAEIAGVADGLLAEAGVPLQTAEQAKFDAAKATAREQLGPARYEAAHAAGLATALQAALIAAGLL